MNCAEFVDFLMAYDDGELDSRQREAFDEHIAECPPCHDYLRSYRTVIDLSQQLACEPDAPIPDEVPDRLVAAVLAARRTAVSPNEAFARSALQLDEVRASGGHMTGDLTNIPSADASEGSEPTGSGRRGLFARIGLLIAAIVALAAVAPTVAEYLPAVNEWIQGLGPWGPLAFIVVYAALVVGFVPGSILTLAAGVLFGVVAGTAYVFVGASLGACVAFLIARYAARSTVEGLLEGNDRFSAIDRAVAQEGRKITFLLRLSPVIPFTYLNYGLGLTQVRFVDYALACIGMLPGTLLYVYLGAVAGSLVAVSGGSTGADDTTRNVILVVGLVITAIVTVLITRIARRALNEATEG